MRALAHIAPGRGAFWLAFYASVLLAWAVLMRQTASPLPGISAADYWAALCLSADGADPWAVFGMWALMSAAMMLPTFVPALRVFADLGGVRASDGRTLVALTFGYAVLWLGFAAAAAGLQVALAKAGAFAGAGLAPAGSAILLLAAGLYQFTPAKAACLAKCRHPLLFFMERWQPGLSPAFRMGVQLGAWCVGCCWVLMLLGLIGGAMNLMWMGAATLMMTIEKLPDIGRFLTRPLGLVLTAAGLLQTATLLSTGG